ncbi:hypothetical protein HY450_01145 [Candidatus Pacearchaeota archaeon]|nr:hypothetical protein [Candidatus Pacearchaeota archaeon]
MDSKQIVLTIVISLIVAVIASAVTASITGAAFFDRIGNTGGPIRANSCDADETCEIREARVDRGVFGGYLSIQQSLYADGSQVQINKPITEDVEISGPNSLTVGAGLTSGHLSVGGQTGLVSLYADGSQVEISKPFTLSSMNGNSSAYACLDNSGKLFRKQTPCV